MELKDIDARLDQIEQAGESFEHVRGRVDKMLADNRMIPDDG